MIPLGETLNTCFELSSYFKDNEINAEVNYSERSFKAKLKDANRREIPFILIVGEEEVKNETFNIKNMQTGEQISCNKEQCIEILKKSR